MLVVRSLGRVIAANVIVVAQAATFGKTHLKLRLGSSLGHSQCEDVFEAPQLERNGAVFYDGGRDVDVNGVDESTLVVSLTQP